MIDKILACLTGLVFLVVVSGICYTEMYRDDVKIVVNLKQNEDPFVAFKQIVPTDSSVKEVRSVNRNKNQYEIIVSTKRKKTNLLEWFRQSYRVESAEIKSQE